MRSGAGFRHDSEVATTSQFSGLDAVFDAAYLIGVLGAVPTPNAALRELRRVLKPGGHIVFGAALVVDRDAVRLSTLSDLVERAGVVYERTLGPTVAYFARFKLSAPHANSGSRNDGPPGTNRQRRVPEVPPSPRTPGPMNPREVA